MTKIEVRLIALILLGSPMFLLAGAASRPSEPVGLRGFLDPAYKSFTLVWKPSASASLAGYNIYRRTTLRGTPVKINAYLSPLNVFADRVNGETFYYSVRAVDADGNESGDFAVIDSSPDTRVYFLEDDSKAPASALEKAHAYPVPFTPNGDGFNDIVNVVVQNPNGSATNGTIFDLDGRLVSHMTLPAQTAGTSTTLTWNGSDTSGRTAPSGLYVYQVLGDGKVITGTVAVAR
jgi:hypothetical protein